MKIRTILKWLLTVVAVVLTVHLGIYYWSHPDMTSQRIFLNKWAEYLLFMVTMLVAYYLWMSDTDY